MKPPADEVNPPGVSVVIPTYRQIAAVARVLVSLVDSGNQLPDDVGFEIIVVDDSPEGDASAIGCTAEHTSCVNPGSVRAPERMPPPIWLCCSRTRT